MRGWGCKNGMYIVVHSMPHRVNNCKKEEVTMVRTCDLQKDRTRRSSREKKKKKAKENMGRQHHRVDRSRFQ